jgi:hypothetical protein
MSEHRAYSIPTFQCDDSWKVGGKAVGTEMKDGMEEHNVDIDRKGKEGGAGLRVCVIWYRVIVVL